MLEGGAFRGEDEEPYHTGGQYHEFVGVDGEEKGAEAGWGMVDPAAKSRGKEEDTDGFGDATVEVSKRMFSMALLGRDRYFIDEANRFPGKAT